MISYNSFSDEESYIKDSSPQVEDEIANWALEYKVKHNALEALLVVLKKYVDQTLPKCARTLLKTPRYIKVRIVNPGSYCHFGIAEECLYLGFIIVILNQIHDFVVEITELIDNGFTFNHTFFKVILHCIICDSPANSFINVA